MTDAEVLALLTDRLNKVGGNKSELARLIKIGRQHLNDVFAGHRRPGPKILAYLGLQRTEVVGRRKRT